MRRTPNKDMADPMRAKFLKDIELAMLVMQQMLHTPTLLFVDVEFSSVESKVESPTTMERRSDSPMTDKDEPRRAKLLKDREEPNCERSKMATELPNLEKLRSDNEEPKFVKSNREILQRSALPRREQEEPMRANVLKDSADPQRAVSKIARVFPRLPQPRSDNEEPKCAKFCTENLLPKRAVPRTEKEEPKRAKVLKARQAPKWRKSMTARELPSLPKLRSDRVEPKWT